MNLLSTEYSLKNKTFEIYLAGCLKPHCINCHNPESWDFNNGYKIDLKVINSIKDKIKSFDSLIDNIWILGGEPLDNVKDDLIFLLDHLSELNKKIWLFTRYKLNEVDEELFEYLDYVKTGKYIDDNSGYETSFGFRLGSINQTIYEIMRR